MLVNAPFSLLDNVVKNIRKDGAKAVLIMPQWEGHHFFEEVQPMIIRKHIYPKGTRVLEQKDGAMAGVRWPVWAALVDGNEQP